MQGEFAERRRLIAIQRRLSQFRHGQSPESVSDWKTVRCAADDSAAGNPRFAHHVVHDIEVRCVAGGRHFGPLSFEQFQTSADINHEIHPRIGRRFQLDHDVRGMPREASPPSSPKQDRG